MSVIHVEKIQLKASCVQVNSVNLKMYIQQWNDKIVNLLIKEFIGINKLLSYFFEFLLPTYKVQLFLILLKLNTANSEAW